MSAPRSMRFQTGGDSLDRLRLECRLFWAALWRDAPEPARLLERTGFEPSDPSIQSSWIVVSIPPAMN